MAESPVNYLLNKLVQLVENEVQVLMGAQEEALSVRGELERVRAFLRVADSLEESDDEFKVWVKQLRNTAYDMEDALDEFLLLLRHDHGVRFIGLVSRMSCCIKNLKARYRVKSEIKHMNSRVKAICNGYQRLCHKFSRAQQDPSLTGADNTWQDNRGNALLLDETDLVGIEQPMNELVKRLLEGALGREVISVVGMGGLGKTALVKQVYEDPTVKKHFMVYAWITLSQSLKIEEVLTDMLDQIMKVIRTPVPPGAYTMNSHWLRRYLIVLDDAWHINEWDAVKHALPNNGHGSRVIITTRNVDLASTSCKESNGLVKILGPLDPAQSWELFCRKTFQGNSCPSHLEETCEYILKKCEGLPLHQIYEWELVRRSLRSEIDCNDRLKNLKSVFSLSFNDLPYYLKSCFLHLSLFPEGHRIKCQKLIRLWVAEGFVEKKEGKTLEEVAKDYFVELLNRSLIEVAAKRSDGRVKYCRIQNILWDIITLKSTDQGFAVIAKEENYEWPDKVCRLSIQNILQASPRNWSLSQLRSLYMFGIEGSSMNTVLASDMKLLNVLDMQVAPLTRFPAQVADWYCLRYLSFRYTEVSTVPSSIEKLQNCHTPNPIRTRGLETLDLKQINVTELPVEILKLRRLCHLLVYRYKNISYSSFKFGFKAPRGIGALQSLQKLCYIEADDKSGGKKEDGRDLCLSISKLTRLRAIFVASVDGDEVIDLQHLSSPPPFLERIYLRGRLGALPHWLPSLSSLMKLNLRCSRLKNDPLVSLQNLPNLVHLELLQVYKGSSLFFEAESFKKLKTLGLDHFDELRCIEVEKGAMPCLEKFIIQHCKLLEKLPSGIEYQKKLKVLKIFDMPDELVKKLVQGGQNDDCQKVANRRILRILENLPSGIEHLTKLKVLEIFDMPDVLVKKLVHGGQDDNYHKVAHVPEIRVATREMRVGISS
ncbi:hypothetical protein BT93_E0744 [Corymbia citriodora subsp. variegata]|nr:hypothetical protein BT93_E0744 [Corymbia citriodora subsp. variegata]